MTDADLFASDPSPHVSQIVNQRYDEEMAEYTAWQAAEKERVAAAKKLPRARKGSKQQQAADALPLSEEGPSTAVVEAEPAAATPKPTRPKKNLEIMLHGIWGPGVPGPLDPGELTATNAAPVSIMVLK